LRKQGVLGVLIDQVENGGVYVDFMGHPAGSTIGAASLALKTGAPLLPMHCVRQRDGKLKVIIEPEFTIRREGPEEELVPEAVAAMNRVVERWVREHPEQWFWGHRRWRKWRK
jgi:KDO2-lipid IV(A) lauroyltransferase